MRDGWRTRSVDDLCVRVTSGGTPRRQRDGYYTTSDLGTPWVKTKELNDCWITDTEEFVTPLGIAESSAKLLPANTVMMAMYGATVGKLGLLRTAMTCNQACCAMVVDPDEGDFRFLFYRLLNDREKLIGLANGAAQQNLSGAVIKRYAFPCPPVEDQRMIAAVLGALDDLIDTNQRLIGQLNDVATATAFRALRLASARVPLAEVAAHLPGKYLAKDRYVPTGRFVVYGSNSIMGKYSEALYEGPLTVLARIGSNCGALRLSPDGAWVNNNASAIKAHSGQPAYWIHAALEQIDMDDHRAGTGQPFIRIESLMKESIPWGDHAQMASTNATLGELANAATTLSEEARAIATARDELLPLLMSGAVSPGEVTVAS